MKKYTLFLLIVLTACSEPDKKAELEELRSERSELEARIAELEAEISKSDTTGGEKAHEVTVMALKPSVFKTYIEVQGQVDAEESVNISTEMPGTITRINVKAGDRVSKGQVLAETDARAAQQQYAAMQTSVALINQLYEKQKNLWDQKIGTEVQFLTIKAQKEAAESALAAMQETLRMAKIISPIDGTVDNINIKLGQAVAPGVPAISVINFSNLTVKAEIAESYSARVKAGDEVLVVFPDMNDSIATKVHYASRAINPLTRTFKVEVALDSKKEYHPNMVAKLRINDYKSEKPVLVLPVKLIQKGMAEKYVFVVEKGKAVKRTVTISREYRGMAEISEGLKEGDMIITEGYDLVNEGDLVITGK
jgi:membrane fusion protein, multidrug efflux system